jgi:ABC-type transport system involved in multi-copper enzyme maturation permease subunit
MSRSARVRTLAHHELRAATRSRLLVVLASILVLVTVVSVYVGAVDYRSQIADYNAYLKAAAASGVTQLPPPPLRLLTLLRGAMEYLEIVGAVIGVALGYLSITRERAGRTLALLRTRPVSTGELAAGNLLGATAVLGILLATTAVAAVACLGIIGHGWVGAGQAVQLLLAYLAALIYLLTFYCLGVIATARSRVAANGLILALAVWLAVVLVLPQIGDTLDADNQVPGGLFAALGLDLSGETAVLRHFTLYENIRTGLEEISLTKHFERFAFAMTDIPNEYQGFSLGQLLAAKRNDIIWLVVGVLALSAGLLRSLGRQTVTTGGQE